MAEAGAPSGRGARALILGVSGTALTADERAFLREADPWGFILFARNIEAPGQVAALTGALREAVGRDAPILIDQEGGRIARLRAPHWREWPAPEVDGDAGGAEALSLRYRIIAQELRAVGVDVNCMPILDVPGVGTHPIIDTRVLARDPATIAERGRAVCAGLMAGGVLPVLKHMPGHGRAQADSHEALPRVVAAHAHLVETDFAPFRALADQPLGMTAHVVYDAIDPDRAATVSPPCLRAIREEIGFDGCLMTDDIGMGALSGSVADRARASLDAGCDLVLHCNGEMAEMEALAGVVPLLEGRARDRADGALARRTGPDGENLAALEARYRRATGRAA